MTKESIYELQNIDCNCTNCLYMVRDLEERKESLAWHKQLDFQEFERRKAKWWELYLWYTDRNEPEKATLMKLEHSRMRFEFDKSRYTVHYGCCAKLEKKVSFIPEVCQLDTQDCFINRKS